MILFMDIRCLSYNLREKNESLQVVSEPLFKRNRLLILA